MVEHKKMQEVLNKLNIQNEIKKILKDSKFQIDSTTGYYYINNRVDGGSLFEYNPITLKLFISKRIKQFLLYKKYENYKLTIKIKEAVEYIFNLSFTDAIEVEESMIRNIKNGELHNLLDGKVFDKVMSIPRKFNISRLLFEMVTPMNDHTINNYTRKFVETDYDKIDISSMRNGVYCLYFYENDKYKTLMKYKFTINNTIEYDN